MRLFKKLVADKIVLRDENYVFRLLSVVNITGTPETPDTPSKPMQLGTVTKYNLNNLNLGSGVNLVTATAVREGLTESEQSSTIPINLY